MKVLTKIIVSFLFFGACVVSIQAQELAVKQADQAFKELAYLDAIAIYKEVAENGYKSAHVFKKLGDAYYFNANYTEAAKWYEKLFQLEPKQSSDYNFKYGQSLKALGAYNKADVYLANYYKSQGVDYKSSRDILQEIKANSNKYSIEKVGFNTKYSDYPAFLNGTQLYVITAGSSKTKSRWNNEPTSDVFKVSEAGLIKLKGDLNSDFNEGSLVITKNDSTMYFTRNNFINRKVGRDSEKIVRLNLYKAVKIDDKWSNIEALPFNSEDYSSGHPALNPDETKLYYVSDKPGGKGGTDIYEVEIYSDGSFGEPVNKSEFNTAANEMFPFVSSNGDFYFASNGHPNLGGLDIFVAKKRESFSKIHNLGEPINSAFDDFAFVINNSRGYFASNRAHLNDAIYSFKPNANYKATRELLVKGRVKDEETGHPIENVLVSLISDDNAVVEQKIAVSGLYDFAKRDANDVKFVRAEKEGYLTNQIPLIVNKAVPDIFLEKSTISIAVGSDIAASLLNPIYFDLDAYFIHTDAEVELQKIVAAMKLNTNIKIEVGSHTDSRASHSYNMALSEKRAQATINYLVKHGIDKSRLSGKGYGATQLVNHCKAGVKCSEAQHQENRRSEFVIID